MGLFNFKNKKEIKEKLKLINNVSKVEKTFTELRLFSVSNSLNKIVDLLDNPEIKLDARQINRINSEIDAIRKYSSKEYEELLKNKCNSIIAIIRNDRSILESTVTSNDNNERIYRLLGEQAEITSQIDVLTEKMDKALGKDKCMWQLLNMQRNTLYNKIAIISKNYSTILTAQSNLELSAEIKKAKEESEAILLQASSVDPGEFEDDANFITKANDEVSYVSDKINDSFAKNFGSNNDDSAYEKALEQKILNQEAGTLTIGNQKGGC